MSERSLYLDAGPGETRGVVALDGLPERLLIERPGDPPALKLGARSVARVRKVEAAFSSAFLDLPDGGEALLGLREGDPRLNQGAAVEIEIRGEPRPGKLATARLFGLTEGPPRLLAPGPSLAEQLMAFAPEAEVKTGSPARRAADLACEAASAIVHSLPSGGSIAIEPTRALTAIDVDLGSGGGEAKKAARRANLEALSHGARLLRLKGQGGLIVFDLVGKGHDAPALLNAARSAFGPDNPGVVVGQLSRFGTLEIALPWRRALLQLDAPPARAAALARALEREAARDPAGRWQALAGRETVALLQALLPALNNRFGGRLSVAEGASEEVRPV